MLNDRIDFQKVSYYLGMLSAYYNVINILDIMSDSAENENIRGLLDDIAKHIEGFGILDVKIRLNKLLFTYKHEKDDITLFLKYWEKKIAEKREKQTAKKVKEQV